MTVESATYIADLNASNPAAGDSLTEGDDHLRLLKAVLKATFTNLDGAVATTDTELGYVAGVTSAIQTQLDAKLATTSQALVFIAEATASNSASIAFTSGITSTYDEYEIRLIEVIPETNNVSLRLRTSTDGGSNYATTSGDYKWSLMLHNSALTDGGTGTFISISGAANISNTTSDGGVSGVIRMINPAGTSSNKRFNWTGNRVDSEIIATGSRTATTAINAIQFSMSSGNIVSGHFKLYGVRKS